MKIRKMFPVLTAVCALVFAIPGLASATPLVLYDTIPATFPAAPGNYPSQPYQAQQTAEFGQAITLAGGQYDLLTVNVLLSNWAYESTYEAVGTSTGFTHDFTLNLYDDPGDGSAVTTPFATQTVSASVPWRPEPGSGGCAAPSYRAEDGNCYSGALDQIMFQFANVVLPDNLIYGLAFNTQSWGADPEGAAGPYNSVNFALNTDIANPYVGANTVPTTVYWDTATGSYLSNPANANAFARDANWAGYDNPAVRFTAESASAAAPVPEPATLSLLGLGLVTGGAAKFRRRKQTA